MRAYPRDFIGFLRNNQSGPHSFALSCILLVDAQYCYLSVTYDRVRSIRNKQSVPHSFA